MPRYQRLTDSVLNRRSPELWRREAAENEFRSSPAAIQSSGFYAKARRYWASLLTRKPAENVGRGSAWRRGWDSNPRYAFTYTRFPSVRLKPLGHLSGGRVVARHAVFFKAEVGAQAGSTDPLRTRRSAEPRATVRASRANAFMQRHMKHRLAARPAVACVTAGAPASSRQSCQAPMSLPTLPAPAVKSRSGQASFAQGEPKAIVGHQGPQRPPAILFWEGMKWHSLVDKP